MRKETENGLCTEGESERQNRNGENGLCGEGGIGKAEQGMGMGMAEHGMAAYPLLP